MTDESIAMQAVRLREFLLELEPDPDFTEDEEAFWEQDLAAALSTCQELMLDLYMEQEALYVLQELRSNYGLAEPPAPPALKVIQGGRT